MKSNQVVVFFSITFLFFFHGLFSQHHEHVTDYTEDFWRLDAERLYWQLPNQTLEVLGVRSGMNAADVGAGKGYFTIRLAQKVGNDGLVYASDIDTSGLRIIEHYAMQEGLSNVIAIQGKEDNPLLPEKTFDVILMVNVLHLLKNPSAYLNLLKPALKANGILAIIQWDSAKMLKEMPDLSNEDVMLHSQEATKKKIINGGFQITKIDSFLPMQTIYFCQ